ncbi:hypothetical protein [Stenotrophomonas maltophilia]|uniref:hypothetical protein n=1 Tax=Stenotrophomonas maltophilia TaxID=40324 RepID=UPI0021C1E29D|nr:hypothetical protein [Stenotrophomonas maltophilia]UXL28523.1 hypothetical protein N0O74_19190 [Stenotrophomonas maltophilia]
MEAQSDIGTVGKGDVENVIELCVAPGARQVALALKATVAPNRARQPAYAGQSDIIGIYWGKGGDTHRTRLPSHRPCRKLQLPQ